MVIGERKMARLKEAVRRTLAALMVRAPEYATAQAWDGGFLIRKRGKPFLRVEIRGGLLELEHVMVPDLAPADPDRLLQANMMLAALNAAPRFGRYWAKEEEGQIQVVYGAYLPLEALDEEGVDLAVVALMEKGRDLDRLARQGLKALKTKWTREEASRPQA